MSKPLEGLLVVALEQALAAPYCSCRLADAGARVIKIERESGDFARGYDSVVHGESAYFVWVNRGKESLQLNIKQADDAALLHRILASADVFIQNLAPGATQRAGFGSDELREKYPKLITCDISGYGDGQAYREMKAYDLLIQAEGGLLSVTGSNDSYGRIGVSICDVGAGMNALIGVQQALIQRSITGLGSSVKVSLFDGSVDWMNVPLLHHDYGGKAPERVGLKHPSIAPYGGFTTADAVTLVIAVQNEREWLRLCEQVLSQPTLARDSRFNSNINRVENRELLDSTIAQYFAQHLSADLQDKMRKAKIAYGAVNSVEALSQHKQVRRWPVKLPSGIEVEIPAPPVQFEDDSGEFNPIPALGQHNETIRNEFNH